MIFIFGKNKRRNSYSKLFFDEEIIAEGDGVTAYHFYD